MSGITGTQAELLFSTVGTGTQLSAFTTEDSLLKTLAPCIIPAGFFFNNQAVGKCLRIKASGTLGFTTGSPTFTFSIRLVPTSGTGAIVAPYTFTTTASILLGATAAQAAGSVAVVRTPWFLDADAVCQNVNIGAASVVSTMGEVRCPAGFASPFVATIPSLAVSPVVSTVDNQASYMLFLSVACGASNALNLVDCRQMKVYGEN